MDESKLHDMNLSNDEIGRLEKAFSSDKFRELLTHYLEEVRDPENRKTFENEIIEMEKQRGNDVLLIKPTPHHVMKTSVGGDTKAYINFASSSSVNKMKFIPVRKDSTDRLSVSIPYSLSPAKKTRDKYHQLCNIYCVVFHPITLNLADENEVVKKAVQETAFSAIERSLNVSLDKINFRTLKKQSKGLLETTMVRRNEGLDSNDTCSTIGINNQELSTYTSDDYITPTHKIQYCNEVNLQNYTSDKYCKLDILVPKYMMIEIHLPLLKSIQNTRLDVNSTFVELSNENPNYKLRLTLLYEVNEHLSSAKFDADSRVLTLQLDVKSRNTSTSKELTLIEDISNDSASVSSHSSVHSENLNVNRTEISFLTAKVKYKLPTYVCNYRRNMLAFTLKVKNVARSSFESFVFQKLNGFWVKFHTLGNGLFPMYYSMRIGFAEPSLLSTNALEVEIGNDNLFLYLTLSENSRPLEYMVGVDANYFEIAYVNEVDALKLKYEKEKAQKLDVKLDVTEVNTNKVIINVQSLPPTIQSEIHQDSTAVKEELQFDNQKLVKMEFTKFCDQFRTQFALDEESHSLSESELPVRDALMSSEIRQINSDAENGSWITLKTNTKRLRRKKKARDKNLLIDECIVEDGVAEVSESANESMDDVRSDGNATSQSIDIRSAYRYSDLSSRSILKKSRSFSESSGDESFVVDYSRSYSTEGINFSSDSCSQTGSKKTVTFNDVISKKLFCSDVSILEQRKRQRRHSRRKAGRTSDSENSETENSEAVGNKRRENIRAFNEILLSETGSETDLTSSLSESGGETSDDQGESLECCEDSGIRRPTKRQQPIPSSKKAHKRRGKKSARKNASSAKHQHHDDAFS